MDEETGREDPNDAGNGDDGKGGAGGDGGSSGDGKGGDGKGDEDTAGLKSALQKERDGRKAADKKATDLEKRLKTLEDAGRTDEEKRTARLAELESRDQSLSSELKKSRTQHALAMAAIDAGARRPVEAAKLVDESLIEYDDDGNVTNAAAVISKTKERVPELFKGGKPSGDADGGNRGGTSGGDKKPSMDELMRAAAGH